MTTYFIKSFPPSASDLGTVLNVCASNPGNCDAAVKDLPMQLADRNAALQELMSLGMLGYHGEKLLISDLGAQVAAGLALSRVPLILPARQASLRLARPEAEGVNWLDLAALALSLVLLAVLLVADFSPEHLGGPLLILTKEELFSLVAEFVIFIGTAYIGAGVIYRRAPEPPNTVEELHVRLDKVLGNASRHCAMGVGYLFLATFIDAVAKLHLLLN